MGKVMLIGAGPGDAQLLTVKGLAALQKADVIVYDRLVEPAMLKNEKLVVNSFMSEKNHFIIQFPKRKSSKFLLKKLRQMSWLFV